MDHSVTRTAFFHHRSDAAARFDALEKVRSGVRLFAIANIRHRAHHRFDGITPPGGRSSAATVTPRRTAHSALWRLASVQRRVNTCSPRNASAGQIETMHILVQQTPKVYREGHYSHHHRKIGVAAE
jgi:hypothetical protein